MLQRCSMSVSYPQGIVQHSTSAIIVVFWEKRGGSRDRSSRTTRFMRRVRMGLGRGDRRRSLGRRWKRRRPHAANFPHHHNSSTAGQKISSPGRVQ